MRHYNALVAVGVAAVSSSLLLFGCAGERTTQGGVEVRAYALSTSDVAAVSVTVTGPGIDAPIVVNLTKVGDQWVANLSEIPTGSDRTFTLSARDGNGVEIYSGVATGVTIVAGQTTLVSISGQETSPAAPVGNMSPVIDALVAASLNVAQGASVALSVTAHDGDVGDFITFQWTATGGSLDTAAQAAVDWTAPAVDGVYRITVEVQDTHGAMASMYVDLTVGAAGSSEATISVSLNKWPVVIGVSSTQGRLDVGESTTLDAVASDADNDPLAYAWTVDAGCVGTFDDAAAKQPTFSLGAALPESATCQFSVAVSDGRGGTNSGSLTVSAGPAPVVTLAPRITSATQSLERVGAGQTVMMSVNAVDPESSALTFAWTATGGGLGTPVTTEASSAVVWTAPSPFTFEVYVKCTVTDASGVATVKMFTIFAAFDGTATTTSTATSTSTTVDVTPPTVSAVSVEPATVDTSAGPATVVVAFAVADELSGIATVSFQLTSPSAGQSRYCQVATVAPAPLGLTSSCNVEFLQNSESGTWTIKSMVIADAAGNVANLGAADLTSYAATLHVAAPTVDTAAPTLAAFSFTPSAVNATNAMATVTVTATITDNLSGLAQAGFMFSDPSGSQWETCWINRPSGSSGLRLYSSTCTVEIPQYSLAGAWTVIEVFLSDEASNVVRLTTAEVAALGFAVDLTVVSDADGILPVIGAFSFSPSTVDTAASSVDVTASFTITDDRSGIASAGVRISSPSGSQVQTCWIYAPAGEVVLNLTGSCTLTIPRYSETGVWKVQWLYASDQADNMNLMQELDLVAAGLSSCVTVTSNP